MLGANRIQVTPHVSPDRIEYQTQEWEIGLFEMEPHYHLNILLGGGKRSNNMNFSVVASNNHIIVDEPLAIFQL